MKFRGGARAGARMVWLGGINKLWNFGRARKLYFFVKFNEIWGKDKKSGLCLKNYAIFEEVWSFSPKISKIPRNLRWRPKKKKKVFISKYARIFMNPWVQPHKQTIFIAKSTKKQFLLTNSGVTTSILGVSGLKLQSSSTKPVNFFEAQSSLGRAQFSFVGAREVIWVGTTPNSPSWRQA